MASNWENEVKSVSLTNEEWNRLAVYLLMTTNYRKGELEACRSLAEYKDENGNPEYPNMASNAKFWEEMNAFIEKVQKAIDSR